MARSLRIEYEGAWYHVMNRGLNRQSIYLNDSHRRCFLKLLADIHLRFDVQTHAYCLMDNHYHLLLHTPKSNLSRAMKYLDGLYAQQFNKSEKRDGAVFRGRYKSILIDADSYLLQLSRYIHLNPVTANMIEHAEYYPWSSYQMYLKIAPTPSWLYCDEILSQFSQENTIQKYKNFVQEGTEKEMFDMFSKTKLPSILGGEAFITKIKKQHLKNFCAHPEIPNSKKLNKPSSMKEILDLITNHYGITHAHLQRRGNRFANNLIRNLIIYFAATHCDFSYHEIAMAIGGIGYTGISQLKRRMHVLLETDVSMQKELNQLRRIFTS